VAVLRAGEGRRFAVMTHGFLGSARNLWSVARRLSAEEPGISILLCDLAGHGTSPPLPPGADLATLAGDLLETALSAGAPAPLWLAGHSLGGRVALRALERGPEAVGAVTLIDASPGPRSEDPADDGPEATVRRLLAAPASASSREEMRAHIVALGIGPRTADWLLMNLVRSGGYHVWRFDRHALAELLARTSADDLWGVVAKFPERVACIRGGASTYVTEEDVRRFRDLGCPVITIPAAGHLVHADRPVELAQALRDRLNRL
jgi:esterase